MGKHRWPSTQDDMVRWLRDDAEFRKGLGELFQTYAEPAKRYVEVLLRRYGCPDTDAGDLFASCLTDLLERKEEGKNVWTDAYDPERSFRYFFRGVLNKYVLRHARRQRPTLSVDAAEGVKDGGPSPDDVITTAWAMTVVRQALERLREQDPVLADVVERYHLGGQRCSDRELALTLSLAQTDDPPNVIEAARKRVNRARGEGQGELRQAIVRVIRVYAGDDPERIQVEVETLLGAIEQAPRGFLGDAPA